MKLRNKKTGEIFDWREDLMPFGLGYPHPKSLAELNEEWEDAPKEFWFIGQDGDIRSDNDTITQDYADRLQAIGNYFETKEEAKKAVEKLKAWKRLKDKGFRFEGWDWKAQYVDYSLDYSDITEEQSEEADKDIGLLFGGEK